MRLLILNLAAVAMLTLPVTLVAQDAAPGSADKPAAEPSAQLSPAQTFSYGVGHQIGRNLLATNFELDLQFIMRGLSEALAGKENPVSPQQFSQAAVALENAAGEKALARGAAFLAENAKKPGVKTTKSGLQYLVLKDGTGETPTAERTVSTHYRGRLINGTVFDSSYQGEEPAAGDEPVSFPVGGVIKGWTEALQLMKVGSRWRLFIPADLAYGKRGAPPKIGPNETLIFEIELLETK